MVSLPKEARDFSLLWLMGPTQAPNQWVLGQLRQEAYHSPLTTTEAKNEWSYTSNSPYAFMVCRQL